MISEFSIIDHPSRIGNNTNIWHFTHIRESVDIGENCVIGSHCYIDTKVTIGDNCKVQSGSLIYTPAKIGNAVFIGPRVILTNDKNPRAINEDGSVVTKDDWLCEPVIIKDGASIGAGAIILAGVTVGKNAVVGAGSVVTKDIPDNATFYGVPARCHK